MTQTTDPITLAVREIDDKLKAALDKANAAVQAMTPEQRNAMWRAQREGYVRGEMALAKLEKGMTVPAPLPKDVRQYIERAVLLATNHGGWFDPLCSEGNKLLEKYCYEPVVHMDDNPNEPPWLPNPGTGVCPVPDGHDVEVGYKNLWKGRNAKPEKRSWTHLSGEWDITHYRDWTAWEQRQAKAAPTVTIPAAEYEAMKAEIAEARSYLKILIARMPEVRDWLNGVGQGTAQ